MPGATIKHYRTGVAGRVPSASNVEVGTIAINYNDGKLFYKNSSNAIAEISGGGSGNTLTKTTDSNGWLEFAEELIHSTSRPRHIHDHSPKRDTTKSLLRYS